MPTAAIWSSPTGQCFNRWGDPSQITSVLVGFNFRRLLSIHSLISTMQVGRSGPPDWCMRIAASDRRFADRLHTSVHWTHVPSLCWWHPPRKGWKLLDQGLILAAHHRGWEWFPKSDHYSVRRSICQLGKTWTIPGLDHLIHTRIVVCQTGFDGLRCRTPHLGPVVRVMWSFSHPPPHKCQTEPSTQVQCRFIATLKFKLEYSNNFSICFNCFISLTLCFSFNILFLNLSDIFKLVFLKLILFCLSLCKLQFLFNAFSFQFMYSISGLNGHVFFKKWKNPPLFLRLFHVV